MVALVAVSAVYVLCLALKASDGFWTIDNGIKFLQIKGFIASGFHSVALPWAGQVWDPTLTCPTPAPPFSVLMDGQEFGIYSPGFSALASLPYRWLGFRGLWVVPMLAGLATIAGVRSLGVKLGLAPATRALAIVGAGLGTPMWFYSTTLWEHTPAVALCTWAIVSLAASRRDPRAHWLVQAGLYLGVSVAFREEGYLFMPLVFGAAIIRRPVERGQAVVGFIAGCGLGVASAWAANLWLVGNPLGVHIGSQLSILGNPLGFLRFRGSIFQHLFLAVHPSSWWSAVLVTPVVGLWAWSPVLRGRALTVVWCAASAWALTLTVTTASALWHPPGGIAVLLAVNGLFATCPLLVFATFAVGGPGPQDGLRVVGRVAGLFCALYWVFCPHTAQGIHWGNRFLLPVYPLLATVAAAHAERAAAAFASSAVSCAPRRLALGVWGGALVLSVIGQVYGFVLQSRVEGFLARLNRAVERHATDAVVTDAFWQAPVLVSSFEHRPVFHTLSRACGQRLEAARLGGALRTLLSVRSAGRVARSRDVVVESVTDPRVRLYDVDLLMFSVRPPVGPGAP